MGKNVTFVPANTSQKLIWPMRSWYIRPDQADYEKLFADQGVTTHQAKMNFTYDLPASGGTMTLELDNDLNLLSQYGSLGGTVAF